MKTPRRLLLCALLFLSACRLLADPISARSARTPVPTWTLPFKVTDTPIPFPTPLTPGPTPTGAPLLSTETPTFIAVTPTPSPTARPGIDPTLGATTPDPNVTPDIPIPPPVPQFHLDKDVVNLLLLGRDTARDASSYRTDVIIVASINKKENSVTLVSIPRDLYVYIPGWTMNRINTASQRGDAIRYAGGGVALLEQTLLYNLGIPIHGWVRIDFQGLKDVVDILGGVEVPVSCQITEWRLKDDSYSLTDDNADHWELYTVEPGVVHMDGVYALWYARSRKKSSDFDRSRRQHQVLRAMFDKALQLDVIPKIPELYGQYVQIVDTDLGLGDILQFAPLAAQLDRSRIKSRFIGRDHTYDWVTSQGAKVLLPDVDAISRLLDEAFQPPSTNVLTREPIQVEIWNGAPYAHWAVLAADNLQWAGLVPVIGKADSTGYATTTIYDYTTNPKGTGAARGDLQSVVNVSDANVIAAPDPNAPYPFRVVLGSDYQSCPAQVRTPHATPTPGATLLPESEKVVHAAAIVGSAPPTDGDLTEWTYWPYLVDKPSFGPENWQGLDDLSAIWSIAWDDQYLYLAVKVKDDAFVKLAHGEEIFKEDSLEIWIDTDPGNRTNTLGGKDFQLGIAPGANPPEDAEAYLRLPLAEAHPADDVLLATQLAPGGYDLEARIPWSNFHVLLPFAGEGFAFTLALNDDDSPGGPDQETQLTNIRDARLTDPQTWGILVLDAPVGP